MVKYAVCEIKGKQYTIEPGKPIEVDSLGEAKNIEALVLLSVDGDKLQLGKPYLKDKIKLDVLNTYKGEKIRVAKYHAKANFRKVTGSRRVISKIVLPA